MKLKISMLLNLIIVILTVIGTYCMLNGIEFMGHEDSLSATKIEMFRFYTVDSNVLMGIVSLLFLTSEIQILRCKKEKVSRLLYILKLIGTVGTSLTFLTVVLYLGPISKNGMLSMFLNANLFFHLITPVLSIITFVFFENTDSLKFKDTFIGASTMVVYAIFYVINVLLHVENGKVSTAYDWYWFVQNGVWTMVIVLPFMLLFTYLISFVLWKINNIFLKREQSLKKR